MVKAVSSSAIAVAVWYQHGSSLACANEVEVTLTLAYKLQVALIDNIIQSYGSKLCNSCSTTDFIHIILCQASITTSLKQQFCSIEISLGYAVYRTPFNRCVAIPIPVS